MQTDYQEYHVPGTYPSWLTPGPQGVLSQDNGLSGPWAYSPAQMQSAYGINNIHFGSTAGDGTGQTIAIIDAYDDPSFVDSSASNFSTSDLAQFDKAFGLADPPSFTKYNQNGRTTSLPGTDPAGPGTNDWEVEEVARRRAAHAMAPGASIDLIECNSNDSDDLYAGAMTAAGLSGVSVVTMSFGASEWSGETSFDADFTTPAGHQGVTFLASTGDTGSPGGYPAYSPNVVAVGGTSLFVNPDNSYNSEVAWGKGSDSWNTSLASGGGISTFERVPAYQQAVETIQTLSGRAIPDVSINADPGTGVSVYDSYNNGTATPWIGEGGTSLASPAWAGLIAIANQGRVAEGGTTLNSSSNPTQTLSALYSLPPTDFHDITVGNNGSFKAAPGYDEVTGLGSPIANLLVPDLAAYGMATQLAVTVQPPALVGDFQPFGVQVSAEDSFGHVDRAYTGSVTLTSLYDGSPSASAIRGVASFTGLFLDTSDFYVATSGSLDFTSTIAIDATSTIGAGTSGLTPAQIRTAYGINNITVAGITGDGTNQTIAIVDPFNDPYINLDLDTFDSDYSLTSSGPSLFSQYGASSSFLTVFNEYPNNPAPPYPPGSNTEEEPLDVEWVHAIAPAAKIDLVLCNSVSNADLYFGATFAAGLTGVSVVSMSFGAGEFSGETGDDTDFVSPGVTFVAATGDSGAPAHTRPTRQTCWRWGARACS